jgi:hypothetical protein
MCVDYILDSPRIAQVDPGDGPLPDVVLSHIYCIFILHPGTDTVSHAPSPITAPTDRAKLFDLRPNPRTTSRAPGQRDGSARALAVTLFIGLGFHRRHHFPTYHLAAAARALLSIGFICWMTR